MRIGCTTGSDYEDVIIAAHRFAMHAMMCDVCSADGNDNTLEGKPRHDA
jgi:hypothetical protein